MIRIVTTVEFVRHKVSLSELISHVPGRRKVMFRLYLLIKVSLSELISHVPGLKRGAGRIA